MVGGMVRDGVWVWVWVVSLTEVQTEDPLTEFLVSPPNWLTGSWWLDPTPLPPPQRLGPAPARVAERRHPAGARRPGPPRVRRSPGGPAACRGGGT